MSGFTIFISICVLASVIILLAIAFSAGYFCGATDDYEKDRRDKPNPESIAAMASEIGDLKVRINFLETLLAKAGEEIIIMLHTEEKSKDSAQVLTEIDEALKLVLNGMRK